MMNDLQRLEKKLIDMATTCHNAIKEEIEINPEDMDFGGNVDDAFQAGINNGRAEIAKKVLKDFDL